ncbi:uridine phosphorylase|uniref:Uridine phosphorylase n=1 Tax=Dendrosporobacter quercicolus TaxID=146817 RepID=A0A1G9RVB5_9FIRM|nr:uridine phosphorylase [Dendrosporobacter quercicolus]NSL49333.1 uridine phosphorylase [Dendrosporobacter quercicolus DSM 1736]SDM27102.1 uridine phosphorylase [Dendrosporobacter quercicolus]
MENEKVRHLDCTSAQIGKYVFLPGDPDRSKLIASYLDRAELSASKREFTTYTGWLDGTKVSATSTGIGGPSAAIAMEELVKLGAHTFIRVGTCGAIQEDLEPGTLIIPTAAIRKEGTSREYLPVEFPAVADFFLVDALRSAASNLRHPYAIGVVECKDSYYGQHEPERMPFRKMLMEKWQAWKKAGALASEMESATLFTVASVLHVRCATVLLLYRNREREKALGAAPICSDTVHVAVETAIEAMRRVIKQDFDLKV